MIDNQKKKKAVADKNTCGSLHYCQYWLTFISSSPLHVTGGSALSLVCSAPSLSSPYMYLNRRRWKWFTLQSWLTLLRQITHGIAVKSCVHFVQHLIAGLQSLIVMFTLICATAPLKLQLSTTYENSALFEKAIFSHQLKNIFESFPNELRSSTIKCHF